MDECRVGVGVLELGTILLSYLVTILIKHELLTVIRGPGELNKTQNLHIFVRGEASCFKRI